MLIRAKNCDCVHKDEILEAMTLAVATYAAEQAMATGHELHLCTPQTIVACVIAGVRVAGLQTDWSTEKIKDAIRYAATIACSVVDQADADVKAMAPANDYPGRRH